MRNTMARRKRRRAKGFSKQARISEAAKETPVRGKQMPDNIEYRRKDLECLWKSALDSSWFKIYLQGID